MHIKEFLTKKDVKERITTKITFTQCKALIIYLSDKKYFKYFNYRALADIINYDKTCFDFEKRLNELKILGKDSVSINFFNLRYGSINGPIKREEKIKKTNPSKKDFLEKYGDSLESQKKWKDIQKSKASASKQLYIKKYGEEEGIKKWNIYLKKFKKGHSLEGYIEKYGEQDGVLKYNNKIIKYKKDNSLEGYIKRYGELEGKIKYNSMRNKISKANSLEGYKMKYGEEQGLINWNNKIIKTKKSNSLSGYIKKYGKEEGEAKYNNIQSSKAITLKKMIELYGPEGEEKYKSWIVKCQTAEKQFKIRRSKSSQILFNCLANLIKDKENLIFNDLSKKEFFIYDKELKKIRFYDFKYKNKLIEFNGDYWHANPKMYNEEFYICKNGYARDIWKRDEEKNNIAIKHGYEILTIWNIDFIKDFEGTIEKCIKYLET